MTTNARDIAMNEKPADLVKGPYILLARGFFGMLGCFAVWWAINAFPIFWQDFSIERITTQIIAGDQFKSETLAAQGSALDNIEHAGYCRPAALRSAAIIKLRMFEVAAAANDRQNEHLDSLDKAIRNSLSCAPADPFLWLALYSVGVTKDGFKPGYLTYLRLSYLLGPREGWIVLKRNPLVFKAFDQLSPDLREKVVNEFIDMLREGRFAAQAADIFVGPAWSARDLILSHLTGLNDSERRRFADALQQRGYDLDVPGVGLAPVDSHRFAPQIRVPQ
jgi:hypothetical protein